MIDNWAEASAVLGSVGIIVGAVVKSISTTSKKDASTTEILLKNQSDQTRILDRLSMLIEHRDTRTEELHKDTHKKIDEATVNQNRKLDEVTKNQREIIDVITTFKHGRFA